MFQPGRPRKLSIAQDMFQPGRPRKSSIAQDMFQPGRPRKSSIAQDMFQPIQGLISCAGGDRKMSHARIAVRCLHIRSGLGNSSKVASSSKLVTVSNHKCQMQYTRAVPETLETLEVPGTLIT